MSDEADAEHVDSYIMGQESMIDLDRNGLYPVVRERNTLANSLVYLLAQLGLEKEAAAGEKFAIVFGREGREARGGE